MAKICSAGVFAPPPEPSAQDPPLDRIKLGNLFGEHLDTKTEEQLLSEMCRLALVAQNKL